LPAQHLWRRSSNMITLLTDFGTIDYFVPAVKGAILSINPAARIVDLTHEIPPQDIESAAFTLAACYRDFPQGTIHLAIVDPGVGSQRRVVVVSAGGHFFVGPDNGIFSYIYARETAVTVHEASHDEFFRHPIGGTFHGRDVFAPLAGWLSCGVSPASFGAILEDYVRLEIAQPVKCGESEGYDAAIIHIDRFGNCITNLTDKEFRPAMNSRFEVEGAEVLRFGDHFAEFASVCEPFAYLGSAGYWEIGIWRCSAAERLGIRRGSRVRALDTPA
jgi:S-adenosyl-L-methionine hydrolase (adenosine-forming)